MTCSGEREREKTTSSVASVHKIEHSYRERERQCIQWVPDAQEEESSLVKPVAEKMMMMMVMVKEGGDGDHYKTTQQKQRNGRKTE